MSCITSAQTAVLQQFHFNLCRLSRVLFWWYIFEDFACSWLHWFVLSGQGVVLARSVYSDVVFVDALLRMGWLSENCEHSSFVD